jgi:hypothetical protein
MVKNFASVSIRLPLVNGLKVMAAKEERSVSYIATRILRKAGVSELTNEELQKNFKMSFGKNRNIVQEAVAK